MKKFLTTLSISLYSLCFAEEPIVIWERNSIKPAYIASFAVLFGAQHRVYIRSLIHTAETVLNESGSINQEINEKIETLRAKTTSSQALIRNQITTQETEFVDQWTTKAFEHIGEDIAAKKPLDPALIAEAHNTINTIGKGFARDFDAWKELGGTQIGTIAWSGIRKAVEEVNVQN
jgi:ElaB/YqjD/DUF883 family membrane-anchored ribosome-binding protein